jgi:hypothetical protein
MSTIIPTRKPNILTGEESVLGSLWDKALGVFDYVASIELQSYANDKMGVLREAEGEIKTTRQQLLASTPSAYQTTGASASNDKTLMYVGLAMSAGALVLLARK